VQDGRDPIRRVASRRVNPAFSDLGKLVAFFLAIVANHLDGFSKMAGMLGIDRALGKKGGTARAKSMTPERTLFQASSIFRWNYARPP
jgi:hypothetical protein